MGGVGEAGRSVVAREFSGFEGVLMKLVLSICVFAALLTLLALPAQAAGAKKKLLLFAKDPLTWSIVRGGGSGRLTYREGNGSYTLQAAGLQPRSSYALIRYEDAPPRGEVLARGVSDGEGRLELHGTWRNWTSKFWLVSGEDVGGGVGSAASLRAWHPERYLFEEKPLGVPCDCPEPEEP